MYIQFRTLAAFDFANYNYVIVFNTNPQASNPTNMPYANAFLTGTYNNFSYAFAVGASYGGLAALPVLLQYYLVPGQTSLSARQIAVSPSLTSFQSNSNGQGNQFTLIFKRLQLNQQSPYTPSPSPSPSVTPTPSPTPKPTPSGATPSPTPTASPLYGSTWYINFFTLTRTGTPVDALGNGPNDNTYTFSIDILTSSQNAIFRPSGYPQVTPSAQITGGEIDNYP
jgi:hypothetical protein